MCYFIHGAVYGDIDANEYEKVAVKHEYRFNIGTKHDVKNDTRKRSGFDYCVTNDMCDCESAVAAKDPTNPELQKYEALLEDIKKVQGIKHIYLCKTWAGKSVKKEETVRLDDINLSDFLANADEGCLYTIDMQ